jgi:hypothetical protein
MAPLAVVVQRLPAPGAQPPAHGQRLHQPHQGAGHGPAAEPAEGEEVQPVVPGNGSQGGERAN